MAKFSSRTLRACNELDAPTPLCDLANPTALRTNNVPYLRVKDFRIWGLRTQGQFQDLVTWLKDLGVGVPLKGFIGVIKG